MIAPMAIQADVYAKTVLILGAEDGLGWLLARSLPAVLVTVGGELIRTPQWRCAEVPMASD